MTSSSIGAALPHALSQQSVMLDQENTLPGKLPLEISSYFLIFLPEHDVLNFNKTCRKFSIIEPSDKRLTFGRKITYDQFANALNQAGHKFVVSIHILQNRALNSGWLCSMPQSLTELNLQGTSIRDNDLLTLQNFPLEKLYLDYTQIGDEGLENLATLKLSQALIKLTLGSTAVTDAGLSVLQQFRALERLSLYRTSIHGQGLASLNKLPLRYLDISFCSQLRSEALVSLQGLQLESLVLSGFSSIKFQNIKNILPTNSLCLVNQKNVGNAELLYIQSPLKTLNLRNTSVTEEGIEKYRILRAERQIMRFSAVLTIFQAYAIATQNDKVPGTVPYEIASLIDAFDKPPSLTVEIGQFPYSAAYSLR